MKQTQHTTKQKNQNKFNKEEKKIIFFFFSQIEKNCYLISYSNIMNKYIKIQNPFLFFLYLFIRTDIHISFLFIYTKKGNKKKDTKEEEGVSNVKERIIKNVYIYSDT